MVHRDDDAARRPCQCGARTRIAACVLLVASVFAMVAPAAALEVALVPFAAGLDQPDNIANAGDARLFVLEQPGVIRIVEPDGSVLPTPFLDISSRVSCCGEQGLLGLAFDPGYAANGRFYVDYTDNAGNTQVSRFSVTANPDVADPNGEVGILSVVQPFSNHNGGDLQFGPDGYLYISLGDGGSGGDPQGNGQNGQTLLGKILRIDVDGGSPYAIPADNPFVGDPGTLDEIWALGLRNPWRFSFDRSTGDLFIADVGQASREEVDFQPAASGGGQNYGWRCYEGNAAYDLTGCGPAGDYVFPIHDYTHADGCAITGGFVYRGSQFPALLGHYLFADYCSGKLWALSPDGGGGWNVDDVGQFPINFTSFGEDAAGEIYAAAQAGAIYHVQATVPAPACPPTPAGGCSEPGKSLLLLKAPGDPARRRLLWKWLKGPATAQADFGDPAAGATAVGLCLYDGTQSLVAAAGVAAVTGWKTLGDRGFEYRDPAAAGDGVSKIVLRGGDAGKSKILVKAKGANLPLPALPLDEATGVTVQMIRSDGSQCWQAVFPAPARKNTGTLFRARIP